MMIFSMFCEVTLLVTTTSRRTVGEQAEEKNLGTHCIEVIKNFMSKKGKLNEICNIFFIIKLILSIILHAQSV